jgi:hypothetical protein
MKKNYKNLISCTVKISVPCQAVQIAGCSADRQCSGSESIAVRKLFAATVKKNI